MPKKIRLGPTAPPLHEQLGVPEDRVRKEQVILDLITKANRMGMSGSATREQHQRILHSLQEKGLIKLKT